MGIETYEKSFGNFATIRIDHADTKSYFITKLMEFYLKAKSRFERNIDESRKYCKCLDFIKFSKPFVMCVRSSE